MALYTAKHGPLNIVKFSTVFLANKNFLSFSLPGLRVHRVGTASEKTAKDLLCICRSNVTVDSTAKGDLFTVSLICAVRRVAAWKTLVRSLRDFEVHL